MDLEAFFFPPLNLFMNDGIKWQRIKAQTQHRLLSGTKMRRKSSVEINTDKHMETNDLLTALADKKRKKKRNYS